MTEQDNWFVYGLVASDSDVIRYVGYTKNPHNRRLQHLSKAKLRQRNYPLYDWIRSLINREVELRMIILSAGSGSDWQQTERDWIVKLQKNKLFNISPGGYAAVISPDSRKRAGEKLKTRIFSDLHRARISLGKTGLKRPDNAARNKYSGDSLRGKKLNISEQERARRRDAAKKNGAKIAKNMWVNMSAEERKRRSEFASAQMKRVWEERRHAKNS